MEPTTLKVASQVPRKPQITTGSDLVKKDKAAKNKVVHVLDQGQWSVPSQPCFAPLSSEGYVAPSAVSPGLVAELLCVWLLKCWLFD